METAFHPGHVQRITAAIVAVLMSLMLHGTAFACAARMLAPTQCSQHAMPTSAHKCCHGSSSNAPNRHGACDRKAAPANCAVDDQCCIGRREQHALKQDAQPAPDLRFTRASSFDVEPVLSESPPSLLAKDASYEKPVFELKTDLRI